MVEDRCNETEILLTGFGGGEELFGDFGDEVERAGGGEVVEDGELRMEEIAGIDVNELASLALEVRHSYVRKALQAGTKTAFRPPRTARDASELSKVARQKADDQVPFLERPGLQDKGFAHARGHSSCMKRKPKVIMTSVCGPTKTDICHPIEAEKSNSYWFKLVLW